MAQSYFQIMTSDDWKDLGFVEDVPGVFDAPGGWILEIYDRGRRILIRNTRSPRLSYDGPAIDRQTALLLLQLGNYPGVELLDEE